ncbi:MAG TPA: rhamnan synthesis F family protein, partial [Flavisolibacter sp.]|nr:rhamnan synthesis F family protein [Flavisolibacter sp.]
MDTSLPKRGQDTKYKAETFQVLHNELPSRPEKLCLFASYSFTGKVASYVFHYLDALKAEGFSIIFISTSKLTADCQEKLRSHCAAIIEKENAGLDFASWQCALKMSGWGQGSSEILLANDSVFGPFHPLGPIFSTMSKRFDVWGMTDNYDIDYHIQSYFVHFNERVIKSTAWLQFWQGMDTVGISKADIIRRFEVGLSRTLIDAGFKLGVHTSIDTLMRSAGGNDREISPPLVYWQPLLKKFNFPFLKRELLISTTINKAYWHKSTYINTSNWRRVVKQESPYPVELVDEFLSEYYAHISEANPRLKKKTKKILFISERLEDGDAQRVLLSFLQWMKNEKDIRFEMIVASGKEDNGLLEAFLKLSSITFFADLSDADRHELKERLSSESVGLIFSNSFLNVEIQQYLSFLNAPQLLYTHAFNATGKSTTSPDNKKYWLKEQITRFIAASPSIQEKLEDHFGKKEGEVSLVPSFIDEDGDGPFAKESALQLKDIAGLPQNAFHVGICNSLDSRMSTDLVPALLAMICKANKAIHIIWLGIDATHSLYEKLDSDLHRAGIREQVHLVPKKGVTSTVFSAIDVFLLPSAEVSYSLLNLELGLRGIPFVSFDDPDLSPEYLQYGMGAAVPYLGIREMSEAVFRYYEERERLKQDKQKITAITREKFLTGVQAPRLWSEISAHFDEEEIVFEDRPTIAILTHIFYDNTWKDIKNKLSFFKDKSAQFLFSVSEACLIKEELVSDIRASFKNAFILTTSNIGKDIGGKFALIDFYLSLELESDYIIFLHDKQSPHSLIGESWKNNLQKIVDFKNYNRILSAFEQDEKVGVVGAREHLISEYDNTNDTFLNNNDKIHEFLKRYHISITNYE